MSPFISNNSSFPWWLYLSVWRGNAHRQVWYLRGIAVSGRVHWGMEEHLKEEVSACAGRLGGDLYEESFQGPV